MFTASIWRSLRMIIKKISCRASYMRITGVAHSFASQSKPQRCFTPTHLIFFLRPPSLHIIFTQFRINTHRNRGALKNFAECDTRHVPHIIRLRLFSPRCYRRAGGAGGFLLHKIKISVMIQHVELHALRFQKTTGDVVEAMLGEISILCLPLKRSFSRYRRRLFLS